MTKLIVAFCNFAKSAYKIDRIENVAEIADTFLIIVIFIKVLKCNALTNPLVKERLVDLFYSWHTSPR